MGPGVMNLTQTGTTLNLTFSPLLTSHGGEYTCQSTVEGVVRTAVTALNVQSKYSWRGRVVCVLIVQVYH